TGNISLAAGMTCGFILGMTPTLSLHSLLIFLILFFFRIQIGAALLAAFFFKFIAFLLDPAFHAVLKKELTVDRFAARYTPAVFVLALAVALLAPPLLGLTPLDGVYRALVLLVIACPCALVIATPVTLVSGLTAAARRGIVIKGGLYLEQARRLRVLAFDKTGTLTTGRPTLEALELIDDRVSLAQQRQWAASLAARSDHPISRAIAASLDGERLPVEALEAHGGRGVSGRINGRALRLANHRWVHELGLCSPILELAMAEHEERGRSVSLLADDQGVLALIAVADQPRPTAAEAIHRLKQLGLKPVMLSGDNARTAAVIANGLRLLRRRSG
ncbi:MAG: cation-translocating P-type ATPase, partial [Synechococcaceae bacterium WB9_3_282]|nr:cation-translocating P-type ATPase [Synechococcaceae bacterium WB9_3_282]